MIKFVNIKHWLRFLPSRGNLKNGRGFPSKIVFDSRKPTFHWLDSIQPKKVYERNSSCLARQYQLAIKIENFGRKNNCVDVNHSLTKKRIIVIQLLHIHKMSGWRIIHKAIQASFGHWNNVVNFQFVKRDELPSVKTPSLMSFIQSFSKKNVASADKRVNVHTFILTRNRCTVRTLDLFLRCVDCVAILRASSPAQLPLLSLPDVNVRGLSEESR